MQIIILIFTLLFSTSPAFAQSPFDRSWQKCKAQSDCILVEGACPGGWVPVNRRFKKEMEAFQISMQPDIECLDPSIARRLPKPPMACVDGFCMDTTTTIKDEGGSASGGKRPQE